MHSLQVERALDRAVPTHATDMYIYNLLIKGFNLSKLCVASSVWGLSIQMLVRCSKGIVAGPVSLCDFSGLPPNSLIVRLAEKYHAYEGQPFGVAHTYLYISTYTMCIYIYIYTPTSIFRISISLYMYMFILISTRLRVTKCTDTQPVTSFVSE